jgi:hypothetical protein
MYQVIKKLVRPSTSVDFPKLTEIIDPAHVEHFVTNYVNTGKHIFRQANAGASELEQITIILWDSEESYNEFTADPVMTEMSLLLSQLCKSLGMTEEIEGLTSV